MLLMQFQFDNIDESKEFELMDDFNKWLCEQLYTTINTNINRRKLSLRMNHLYEVSWINWDKNHKYNTGVSNIMHSIHEAITYTRHKNNLWIISIDANIRIPNSYTSIDRLIRFLNYGDNKYKATGIFTKLAQTYNFTKLNGMWKLFVLNRLGYVTTTRIVGE